MKIFFNYLVLTELRFLWSLNLLNSQFPGVTGPPHVDEHLAVAVFGSEPNVSNACWPDHAFQPDITFLHCSKI